MKLRIHTCKATCCQRVISVRMLMCLDHWRMVPAGVRRDLTAAYRRSRYDDSAMDTYRGLVAQAVAAVEEKQERKAMAAAGPSGSLFT